MSDTDLPTHVGIILDGNRRWAKDNNLPTLEGHRRGADNLTTISRHAFKRGVKYISAYIFSNENWSRSQKEVSYLMNMVPKMMDKYLDELHRDGVKIIILGRRDGLRSKVLSVIDKVEAKTKNNTKGVLALCFNYGGHEEIIDAAKSVVAAGQSFDNMEAKDFAKHLYAPELPDVDLLIRTSGEHRISGFMLYRLDYAELYFTGTHWPAFSPQEFDDATDWFAARDRRFGS